MTLKILMRGVKSNPSGAAIELKDGRYVVSVEGFEPEIDVIDLIQWIRDNRPELLEVRA